ncbi:hypothetical protein ACFPM3_30145 [Streptomyces coeruleoprunus]|uniref:Uncharacterized protein n=1 Tax=Streptomyces coeruleoprunus TaxID=285563 RepID=A0ABV9XLY8_9ACTN
MAERGERAGRDRGRRRRSDKYPYQDTTEQSAESGRRRDRSAHPGTPPPPPPADDLPGLLAVLGQYLERHAPDEVVVLLREEIERREFRAYADGWRDAGVHYERALEEARAAAGSRTLRLVGRTPGRAAVIPFPDQRQERHDDAAEADQPGERDGGTAPSAGRPAFVPKSRTSKVPTIPRLTLPRRPRRPQPPAASPEPPPPDTRSTPDPGGTRGPVPTPASDGPGSDDPAPGGTPASTAP